MELLCEDYRVFYGNFNCCKRFFCCVKHNKSKLVFRFSKLDEYIFKRLVSIRVLVRIEIKILPTGIFLGNIVFCSEYCIFNCGLQNKPFSRLVKKFSFWRYQKTKKYIKTSYNNFSFHLYVPCPNFVRAWLLVRRY